MTNNVKLFHRSNRKYTVFFRVFQLTALIVLGLVTSAEKFIISLERVMIVEDEVRVPLLYVQVFVRSPHFTPRKLFYDSGIAMLAESAAICDSITSSLVVGIWSHAETAFRSQVVAEVFACVNRAVDWRRAVKVSHEQWLTVGSIRPSSEESASRSGVGISYIVEEGRVKSVPVSVPSISTLGPSSLHVSSGKTKKRKISRSPVNLPSCFEIASTLTHLNKIVWLRFRVLCCLGQPAMLWKIKVQWMKPESCSVFPRRIAKITVASSPKMQTALYLLFCHYSLIMCIEKLFFFFFIVSVTHIYIQGS